MNAPLKQTTVTSMQFAPILKEALRALVTVAGLEMESVVLVSRGFFLVYFHLPLKFIYLSRTEIHWVCFIESYSIESNFDIPLNGKMSLFLFQISMNALMTQTTVTPMRFAPMWKGTLHALVTVAGLEMESVVLVS